MRAPLIAGNWKMNKSNMEATALVRDISYQVDPFHHELEIVVCPTFTALRNVGVVIDTDNMPLGLGAQNLFWEDSGAYTGEISGPMLVELHVKYVIVGHSERRQLFGETDESVNKRLKAAFRHGLRPILCVGETLEQREAGQTSEVVTRQMKGALGGIAAGDGSRIVVAYEPVWAIGTGRNAEPKDANDVSALIRSLLGEVFGGTVAQDIRILYGGSVTPHNIEGFVSQPHIDGALVGGASLEAESFARIVELTARTAVPS